MLILVKKKIRKISILVEILLKILFLSSFSKIISILVKSIENLDFGKNFR